MRDEGEQAGSTENDGKLDGAEKLAIARGIVALLIIGVFIAFIALNSDRVTVHLVFATKRIRLIWVFLGCGVIGALVGWIGRERWVAWRAQRRTAPKR
ncbi:MAG: LapA family protein [Actinobacteria bacterium]|nr:LapA family protein [Actinomycetota bacterium]